MNHSNLVQRAAPPTSDRAIGPIEFEVQKASEGVLRLHDEITDLVNALELVSASAPPATETKQPSEVPQCTLHDRLMGTNQSINTAIARIVELRSRLRL